VAEARLRAVLFDAVGTLIRLREPVGETYARFAAEHGARIPAGRLEEAFARCLAAAPPMVFPGEPLVRAEALERAWWRRLVDDTFRAADGAAPPRDFDALFAGLWQHYAGAAAWELAPGARDALLALRGRGLATGIVSNFDQRLRPVLRALAIHHLFHAIVLPAEIGAAKPDRAIFDAALKRLGLAGEQVAYVGDRAAEDVMGSRAAGLRPIDAHSLATLAELPRALGLAEVPTEGS
jgi:putative hydrolase of the HAD superfamily